MGAVPVYPCNISTDVFPCLSASKILHPYLQGGYILYSMPLFKGFPFLAMYSMPFFKGLPFQAMQHIHDS